MLQAFSAIWQNPYIRVLVTLLTLGGLLYLFYLTLGVWMLALAAFLIAYLAYPVLAWSARRFRARWLGVVFFLGVLVAILGSFAVLISGLVGQLALFSEEFPELLEGAVEASERLPRTIAGLPLPGPLRDALFQAYESLNTQLGDLTSRLLSGLTTFVTGGGLLSNVTTVAGGIIQVGALLVLTIYFLVDLPRINRGLVLVFPKPYQPVARDIRDKFEHAVGDYFRGQLAIALFVGLVTGIGLALLRVPLALSLGFLAGVFNLVPYLGVLIAIAPALLLAATLGWFQVVGVLAVFTLANQLETHLLSPLILGRSTQLHPAAVIIAILLGSTLAGIWGAVLAVPVAAFLKLLYTDYYQQSRFYKNG